MVSYCSRRRAPRPQEPGGRVLIRVNVNVQLSQSSGTQSLSASCPEHKPMGLQMTPSRVAPSGHPMHMTGNRYVCIAAIQLRIQQTCRLHIPYLIAGNFRWHTHFRMNHPTLKLLVEIACLSRAVFSFHNWSLPIEKLLPTLLHY